MKPGYVFILIAICFLIAGYVETHEPTPHYAQVECDVCHLPNLDTYSKYAKAWPSTREGKK